MIGEMQLITSFCTSSPVALHVVFLFSSFFAFYYCNNFAYFRGSC